MLIFTLAYALIEVDLHIKDQLYAAVACGLIIMTFVTSVVMDQTLALFSQRKVVFVVSDCCESISQEVQESLKIGGTLLNGCGIYSKAPCSVLMTVINNIQLKRLEEAVFTIDENALLIVENTFSVLGKSFSKRKIY